MGDGRIDRDDENYVTRAEFLRLEIKVTQVATSVQELTGNVNTFLVGMEKSNDELIHALSGRVSEGYMPVSTHKQIVKGVFTAFFILLAAAIGAVKILPIFLK